MTTPTQRNSQPNGPEPPLVDDRPRAQQYAPPHTIPPVAQHDTIENEAVKLAPEIDPHQAPTEHVRTRWRRRVRSWRGIYALGLLALGLVALVFVLLRGSAPDEEPSPADRTSSAADPEVETKTRAESEANAEPAVAPLRTPTTAEPSPTSPSAVRAPRAAAAPAPAAPRTEQARPGVPSQTRPGSLDVPVPTTRSQPLPGSGLEPSEKREPGQE
jgi:hypothetical protein